MQYIQTR